MISTGGTNRPSCCPTVYSYTGNARPAPDWAAETSLFDRCYEAHSWQSGTQTVGWKDITAARTDGEGCKLECGAGGDAPRPTIEAVGVAKTRTLLAVGTIPSTTAHPLIEV